MYALEFQILKILVWPFKVWAVASNNVQIHRSAAGAGGHLLGVLRALRKDAVISDVDAQLIVNCRQRSNTFARAGQVEKMHISPARDSSFGICASLMVLDVGYESDRCVALELWASVCHCLMFQDIPGLLRVVALCKPTRDEYLLFDALQYNMSLPISEVSDPSNLIVLKIWIIAQETSFL